MDYWVQATLKLLQDSNPEDAVQALDGMAARDDRLATPPIVSRDGDIATVYMVVRAANSSRSFARACEVAAEIYLENYVAGGFPWELAGIDITTEAEWERRSLWRETATEAVAHVRQQYLQR